MTPRGGAQPRRGDRDSRGYGLAHKKLRAKWARALAKAGEWPCARCGAPIYAQWPSSPPTAHAPRCPRRAGCEGECWMLWDLGHTEDRTAYTGPEHRSCNRSAGAVNSNRRKPPPDAGPSPSVDYGW